MTMYESLNGQVALVTGAAQGLGEVIARDLAASGARVVLSDVRKDAGQAIAEEIGGFFFSHDVSDEDAWSAVIRDTIAALGRIDVLVNNAGLIQFAPMEEMTVDMFDAVQRVNVRGSWLGCKAVLPAMRKEGGSIINMSSMNGIIATAIGQTAYATSKGAIRMLTKAVAKDYVQYGIRVNAVHPGTIASTFVKPFLDDPERAKELIGHTMMGRVGEPLEVARVVSFLASSDASYITGASIAVDGGITAS